MVKQWTEQYSEELSAAIIRFEIVTKSWAAFQEQDSTLFVEVATGTALRARQLSLEPSTDIGTYVSQDSVWLKQVRVISYTESMAYIETIVHSDGTRYYLDSEETKPARYVTWTLYRLAWEDETWKVSNFVSCPLPERDPDCQLPEQLDP